MSQAITISAIPGNFMQTLNYSQGDVGREFVINVDPDFTIPSGATVEIVATKPSGFGFTVAGSVTDNSVTFTTTEAMTDEWGAFAAELKITHNSDVIGTANFWMKGEQNPHPDSTVDGQQGTIVPQLTLLVERVETAASNILDMTVTANTLAAGSDATYSYDEETNTATFGIPRGADGSLASGVLASTYSSSATYAVGDYVYYSGDLYRCTTAITTAEAWTAGHWTEVALADEVSDVKEDLELYTGNKSYTYTKDKSISNSSPITQSSETSWESVIVPCVEGDTFSVLGYGGSSTRLWMFADSEGNLISQSVAQLRINYYVTITAPPNAAYLSCNSMYTNTSGSLFKGKPLGTAVSDKTAEIAYDLSLSNQGLQTFRGLGNFHHYGLNTDGTFMLNQAYRVSCDSSKLLSFDRDITISVSNGFKWGYIPFSSGTAGSWAGWFTTPQNITAGTEFVIQIARTTEVTSEIADVSEFLDAVYFNTALVSNITEDIKDVPKTSKIVEDGYWTLDKLDFEAGSYSESGKENDPLRIRISSLIEAKKGDKIKLVTSNGLYLNIVTYSDTSYSNVNNLLPWTGTNDTTVVIPNDCYVGINVANASTWGSSTAIDTDDYNMVVKVGCNAVSRIITSIENINGDRTYLYNGEKMPSKCGSFDISNIFSMSYSDMTSQDIDVFGNYLFVAFSGTEQIRVYSLTDYSLVASMVVDTFHGSSMQFSKEYYNADDEFPLLYVGGWTSNKINVIRIVESGGVWTATSVKKIYIPTTYGYYASPNIDGDNNILYVYAHSNASIPNTDDMIISRWDLSNMTDNGDGTYTPEYISHCTSPSVGTYQGHKYYGGRIYITSARSSSPYNQKIFAINCADGGFVTTIDMSNVLTTETEGLCYRINGNNIEWILSEYLNVYKILF